MIDSLLQGSLHDENNSVVAVLVRAIGLIFEILQT